jgi:hypothetical protein
MTFAAGYDADWKGTYDLPRGRITPPLSVIGQVWPELDEWGQKLRDAPMEQDKATGAFLELLDWLRIVLLQDAPFLMMQYPEHPLFSDPVFSTAEFTAFASQVMPSFRPMTTIASADGGVGTALNRLESGDPFVLDQLQVVSTQQKSTASSLAELLDEVRHLRSEVSLLRSGLERSGAVPPLAPPPPASEPQEASVDQVGGGMGILVPSRPSERQAKSFWAIPRWQRGSQALDFSDVNPEKDRAPQYKLPRGILTVVDLLKVWREGFGETPSVDSLDAKWGPKWRRADKAYFNTRRVIIDEVVKRAEAEGVSEWVMAEQMDREREGNSLDRVQKAIRREMREEED